MKDERHTVKLHFHFSCLSLLVGVIVLFLSSCHTNKPGADPNRKKIARVYDKILYADELNGLVGEGTSKEDSVRIIKNYITNWTRDALLLRKAESNLSDDQKNVEKQLEAYRKSLILYAYEKELIRQKLDTVVSSAEIEQYYQQNQKDFELKDNILKVIYVKVNKKAPQLTKLRTLYKSDQPKDREALQSYCHQFAENYYLDDNSWLLFDDLLKEIPIETYNKELFLQNNRFVEVTDSLHYYFVNIKGFKIKNSISPLAFERTNIRNILINKRKLQLINRMQDDVVKTAEENKDLEYYP